MNHHPPTKKFATYGDEARDLLRDLLSRFPGLDHSDLLVTLVAFYFMDLRYGNKREERAACDFLNLVQELALRQINKKKKANP